MTDVLARGLNAEPLTKAPLELPPGACCAVTGAPLERGYRCVDVIPKAAGELLDMLNGQPQGWLSESAARLFNGTTTWNLGSRLVFEDGTMFWPLIARPKEGERPCWSALVRQVWRERAGQRCVAILTTDVKKRLWPLARLGVLGPRTPVTIYDAEQDVRATLAVSWSALIDMLDVIEVIYSHGFAKRAMRASLFSDFKRTQEVGYDLTRGWERQLAGWRGSNEFVMATLIAQKEPL